MRTSPHAGTDRSVVRGWAAHRALFAAAALVVVAAANAGWFGWRWAVAAHDDALTRARTRDEVLRVGETEACDLSTVDYRDPRAGLDRWEKATTGVLHDQLVAGAADFLTKVRQAGVVTVARVVEGALREFDERAGTASVIVAVDVSVTPEDQPSTDKREALRGQLIRTADGWKVSQIDEVPVTPATG